MTDEEAAEIRYEAGMYKCLYELWEKRATEWQGEICRLQTALNEIRTAGNPFPLDSDQFKAFEDGRRPAFR